MSTSTPNSVARYRPALLILAGAAAAYATYLVYSVSQSSQGDGLHRSNAVRRPNAHHRRQVPSQNAPADPAPSDRPLEDGMPTLAGYNLHGTHIPFDPHGGVISRNELEHLISQQRPHIGPEEMDRTIEHVYSVYLDQLFALIFGGRLPPQDELQAIAGFIADQHGDSVGDSAAVTRAIDRYTSAARNAQMPELETAESVVHTELSLRSDDETEGDALDTDGQALQRTLYHIAEDRARQEGVVHRGITCNGCDEKPIRGIRWHCANCADFDLCSNCEATNSHFKTHVFYKIRVPAPYLGMAKQEPLYPGVPHMMNASIHSGLKKRLVVETKMDIEEVEALWDQFTCLAGTEWLTDPNKIGWALDRRAFDHAFVPRYNSFVAAPNLIYDRIFAYYDSDKNGLIGFEEWIKGLDGMHSMNGRVKSRIVFNGYDIDGDGYISRKDVLRLFRAYYAIEKEATRNYVAEITEEISVRNALDTIRSSQPLGSAFPPNGTVPHPGRTSRLMGKHQDDFENMEPILHEDQPDTGDREEILRASDIRIGARPEEHTAVTDRWARRQFYLDEEEGMTRPDGAPDDLIPPADDPVETREELEDTENTSEQPNTRPRWSRSSSRVRFQDDVDIETRSNASTSSRPCGERWGGYEIPEPEKALGQEVLYQITQQAFNELLDPLFEDKETNAMDVSATHNHREELAVQLDQITVDFMTQKYENHRAISKIGIFRYSRCMLDMFINALNNPPEYENCMGLFCDDNGLKITEEEANSRLSKMYTSLEDAFLTSIKIPDDWTVDNMSLWNIWLCRDQLRDEILGSVVGCACMLGWVLSPDLKQSQKSPNTPDQLNYRDPTMPQFRPNSDADIVRAEHAETPIENSETNPSTTILNECDISDSNVVRIFVHPRGPFFVLTRRTQALGTEPVTEGDNASTTEIRSPARSSNGEAIPTEQAPLPDQENSSPASSMPDWHDYSDDPIINLLYVEVEDGVKKIKNSTKGVFHPVNPYHQESDQLRVMYQHIRAVAMDPDSKSHHILLASLNAMEQEIKERKGSGLINFEEFDGHLQEGRLRFLESWLEWVSI